MRGRFKIMMTDDDYIPPVNPFLAAHRAQTLVERQERTRAYWKRKIDHDRYGNRKWLRAYEEKHRDRVQAREAVASALKSGVLRSQPCEGCGSTQVVAHHDSYHPSRWLQVRWVCRSCHDKIHAQYRASRSGS